LLVFPNRSILVACGCIALAVAAVLAVSSWQAKRSPASPLKVKGAAALSEEPAPQETAGTLRPTPANAEADRSRIIPDGCLIGEEGTHSSRCLYGRPHGHWTVILFGDSHAMQYFPPLEVLAKKNHWRLIVLNKRECPPPAVKIRSYTGPEYWQCDVWRRKAMRRIEQSGSHTTVVMSGAVDYTAYSAGGRPLRGRANARALEDGYLVTLKRIRHSGAGTAVIRDMPTAPRNVPACVAENRSHLRKCAFRWHHRYDREFDVRAAKTAPGGHLIDLTPEVCPHDLCRAVIGNALVYRDKHHLSATFARTLSPWIGAALEQAGVPSTRHPHP
jgi:hypothetical protein